MSDIDKLRAEAENLRKKIRVSSCEVALSAGRYNVAKLVV